MVRFDRVSVRLHIAFVLGLFAPGAVFAAPCDMTPFKEIDQRYIEAAPACLDSGDYTSEACAEIAGLMPEISQASASIKAQGCEDLPYDEDPRLAPLRERVLALAHAQAEKERVARPARENQADESGSAEYDNGAKVCTQLMHDIEQKYDFSDLKWLRNQTDTSRYFPILPCTYEAIRPTVYGNTPVIIEATINLSNQRYRIKVH